MDSAKKRRGRRKPSSAVTTSSDKVCRYCKGRFTPNPNQAKHEFCKAECRKAFHKYGAFPAAKFKADIEAQFAKRLQAELAPLRARLDALERMDSKRQDQCYSSGFDDGVAHAKRGGGVAA